MRSGRRGGSGMTAPTKPRSPELRSPELLRRAKLLRQLRNCVADIRRLASEGPSAFRQCVRLDAAAETAFGKQILPWQERDFRAVDAAWKAVAGVTDVKPGTVRRAWIERPRGHAKTSDVAVQIAWTLLFCKRPVRGVAAAADLDQAALISDALRNLAAANPGLCDGLKFKQHAVEHPATGGRLDLISSDIDSSFGITPDFIICDELCHWPREGLWHSLASAAAKRPHCLLAVMTNAGVGRGWQWRVREAARTRPTWHFSSLAGAQAPWIRPAELAEQRALLPVGVFDRLWNNRWQDATGDFLTAAEVTACRDVSLEPRSRGLPGVRYIAAIDYAEKHDLTAAVVLHRVADGGAGSGGADGSRLVVDRLDVAVPRPGAPVLVAWVEEWMARIAAAFPAVTFVLDDYQMLGTIQKLAGRVRIVRFPFAAGRGNHELALTLRRLIVHRQLCWYPGCGARPDDAADTLESELAALLLRTNESGRVRFDHPPAGHDDRAFALAAAAWYAVSTGEPQTLWQVETPGGFGW